MGKNIILSVVAQTSFLNTLFDLYLCNDELPYPSPARACAPRPLRHPPPRADNVGHCCYRRRLLPLSAVAVVCCQCRPLPLSAVVIGRCCRCRRLLPSAVFVGCCHCIPLTSSYAAAVVYHCLCGRLLPTRTTASCGGVRSKLGVSGC